MKKSYFVYDGRAYYDIESACVVESFQADNDVLAAKYHANGYRDEDTVLCDSDDNIIY